MLRILLALGVIGFWLVPAPPAVGDPANPPQLANTSAVAGLSGIARIRGPLSVAGGCTAVLVTPRFALTAAHCAGNAANVLVFNPSDPQNALRRNIAQVKSHPEYDGRLTIRSAFADLAIVELAQDVPTEFAQPIPIHSAISFDSPHAIYGYRNPGNPPLVGHPACLVRRLAPGVLGSNCRVQAGMSGAPLLAQVDGTWSVVGITVATVPSGTGGLRALVAEIDPDLLNEAGIDRPPDALGGDLGPDQDKEQMGPASQ